MEGWTTTGPGDWVTGRGGVGAGAGACAGIVACLCRKDAKSVLISLS